MLSSFVPIVRPVSSFEFVKVGEEWFSCQEKLAEDFHDQLECFCGNDLDEARAAPITLLPTKRKTELLKIGFEGANIF